MRMSRLAWLLKAELHGPLQLLVSYNCKNFAEGHLYYCRTHTKTTRKTSHIIGERKGLLHISHTA